MRGDGVRHRKDGKLKFRDGDGRRWTVPSVSVCFFKWTLKRSVQGDCPEVYLEAELTMDDSDGPCFL